MSRIIITLFLLFFLSLPVAAADVGGGVSVFVPLSLMESGEGSVTFEESLETSLGFGPFLSLPVGFVYNRVDGFRVKADGLGTSDSPWFYGDCFMPYVMLKAHLPVGFLYLDLFGGGAANWSFVLNPRYDKIQGDLQGVDYVADVEYQRVWGYGYLAGAAAGVTIDKISVDLGVTWRDIRHTIDLTVTDDTNAETEYTDAQLLLQGISIALKGSFSL